MLDVMPSAEWVDLLNTKNGNEDYKKGMSYGHLYEEFTSKQILTLARRYLARKLLRAACYHYGIAIALARLGR